MRSPAAREARAMAAPDLIELYNLRAAAEVEYIEKRGDKDLWLDAWRARDRWDDVWEDKYFALYKAADGEIDFESAVKAGVRAWSPGRLKKARPKPPPADEMADRLRVGVAEREFKKGAMAAYLGLAEVEGEEAGKKTLRALGINKTFTWTGLRDFARNPFAIRGSKIIDQLYKNHLSKLAQLVLRKTDPAHPKTIGQLTREIRAEWPELARKDAQRVARTEAAHVWETTNWNAMALNDVREVEWLIGRGPSIGPPRSEPVCELCLLKAANSPYVMEDLDVIAPLHPNCRCTVVHRWTPEWLPPADPWVGDAKNLQVFV